MAIPSAAELLEVTNADLVGRDSNRRSPPSVSNGFLLADEVCNEIAPMWGLTNFVAVNPFWGLRKRHFLSALRDMREALGEELLMPADYYAARFALGEFGEQHIQAVIESRDGGFFGYSREVLKAEVDTIVHGEPSLELNSAASKECNTRRRCATTIAHVLEDFTGRGLNHLIVSEIGKFCSLTFGNSPLRTNTLAARDDLFSQWLSFAQCDRSLDFATSLPVSRYLTESEVSTASVVRSALEVMNLGSECQRRWLRSELATVKGWAAYLQHLDFERAKKGEPHKLVLQLLSIRLAYSLALLELATRRGEERKPRSPRTLQGNVSAARVVREIRHRQEQFNDEYSVADKGVVGRYVCQLALEYALVDSTQRQLQLAKGYRATSAEAGARPAAQIVLCIDVRSEPMRRALELQSDGIETYGFAGFFGLSIVVDSSKENARSLSDSQPSGVSQYPVLLDASYRVEPEGDAPFAPVKWAMSFSKSLLKKIGKSPTTTFNYVESFGLGYGVRLISRALGATEKSDVASQCSRSYSSDMTLAEKVSFVRSFLKNTSIKLPLAQVVILCGHKAETTNNPYQAGFDCGACGGHSGEINARVACAILNDSEVRSACSREGIAIPSDTQFIPAVHNTTTDELLIDEDSRAAIAEELLNSLRNASMIARRERAQRFPSCNVGSESDDVALKRLHVAKSLDWSEIRPEWGLARNALFVVARREVTRGVNLDARAFLHEYDPARDPERSTLELILTAPGVVANWINLQYYASSVAPSAYGAGDKIVHNVVGNIGVVLGNGGDLQCGLPLQCVHDGEQLVHQPLRLSMLVEAPPSATLAIVQKSEVLSDLVANEWLFIYTLAEDGEITPLRLPSLPAANLT